jgi:hypothetical protein
MKPLLVGELNPYGVDPRFALYPLPRGASGDRLRNIFDMSISEYIGKFDRKNLCVGTWSNKQAREAANIIKESQEWGVIILLGAKVSKAFGFHYTPFEREGRYLILPHPSGRNFIWNSPNNIIRARKLVRNVLW